MKKLQHVLTLLLTLAMSSLAIEATGAESPKSCATDPRLVAPCYTVHGKLRAWNGAPTYRIWIVGTKRVIGVSEGLFPPVGYELLPPNIPTPTDFNAGYLGDFTVCPFEQPLQGKMRLVCVAAVKNLVVVKR